LDFVFWLFNIVWNFEIGISNFIFSFLKQIIQLFSGFLCFVITLKTGLGGRFKVSTKIGHLLSIHILGFRRPALVIRQFIIKMTVQTTMQILITFGALLLAKYLIFNVYLMTA